MQLLKSFECAFLSMRLLTLQLAKDCLQTLSPRRWHGGTVRCSDLPEKPVSALTTQSQEEILYRC